MSLWEQEQEEDSNRHQRFILFILWLCLMGQSVLYFNEEVLKGTK